ncbi:MAG: N-6 DNA methylase, partial [Polyangiaceae bacterium]
LWGVADRDRGLELRGWCSNPTQRAITRKLGDFADTEVEVECVSFGEILAKDAAVDAIISIFPFGVRLPDRYEIEGAASTNQFDTLLLDRVTRWLRPGGRAVIAVPPRLLFAEDSATAAVRARIAQALRIVAVIELPAGVFRGTNVPVGIVVLERSESGETLVARLRDDWELQLAPSGDFFRTYQQHLLRPSS